MKSRRYEILIFDFDGTLMDTAPDIAYHANAVLKSYGFTEKPIQHVKNAIGKGVHQLIQGLTGSALDGRSELLEEMVTVFKRRYALEPVLSTCFYPGALEALRGPLKALKKSIVTNKPHDLTLRILDHFGVTGLFEEIVGAGIGHPSKPDPDSTRLVLQRCRTQVSDALFVGDSDIDRETSVRAGVDFAWMDYGYDDSLSEAPGVRRFSSIAALVPFVLGAPYLRS